MTDTDQRVETTVESILVEIRDKDDFKMVKIKAKMKEPL